MHSPEFEKKIEKAFGHIFDELESEVSVREATFAKKYFSVPDK